MLPFLMAALPALIGGGFSLAGTMMSAQAAKEAALAPPPKQSIDFKQMAADARAAGFNPLTVLRSGGAAGYQQTHAPALSSISPLGEGLQAIGGAVSAFQFDPYADRRAQVEFGIAQETLKGLQRDNRTPRVTMDPVSYKASAASKAVPWKIGEPAAVVPIRMGGFSIKPALGWSNAQEVEDRYGDVMSWMYGMAVVGADGFETAGGVDGVIDFSRYLDQRKQRVARGGWSTGGGF